MPYHLHSFSVSYTISFRIITLNGLKPLFHVALDSLLMWHFRCTTVPLKAMSDQVLTKFPRFLFLKTVFFICGFFAKVTRAFLASETKEKLSK